jgi:hypothetical protein
MQKVGCCIVSDPVSQQSAAQINAEIRNLYFSPESSARSGPAYAGIPYRNFFLFLNFIPAFINIYYIHSSFNFSDGISLFAFKKYTGISEFAFRALRESDWIQQVCEHDEKLYITVLGIPKERDDVVA